MLKGTFVTSTGSGKDFKGPISICHRRLGEGGGTQRSFRGNRVVGGESVLAILSIKGDYRKLTANTEPYGRIR